MGEGISVEVGFDVNDVTRALRGGLGSMDGNDGLSDANMTGGGGKGDGSDVNAGVGASVE
jgi:hypothetical protein